MSKLSVVGIGPGDFENMTIRADRALRECDLIIGYSVYVELVKDRYPEKEFLSTPMTKETVRCQMALEAAEGGQNVCMICSGDSGIYGMAALIFELSGDKPTPEIEMIPGITAACSGASLLGAPLTHDFAVISLSDRLTEWNLIEKRLRLSAQADLSLAIYNPCSKSRPDHLKNACDILLEVLPGDRICGIAENIGRTGERCRILSLSELRDAEVNMFCTVFVGNSSTFRRQNRMITPRGYRNV